jgi:hypothetical protein
LPAGVDIGQGGDPEACFADQLSEYAARPECDERAENGVLQETGEKLGSAAEHRLYDDGESNPLCRRADGRLVLEVECDATALGLVGSRGSGLDDGRESQLDSRSDRSLGVLGDPLGDEGQTVGGQQLPRLGGIEPGVL